MQKNLLYIFLICFLIVFLFQLQLSAQMDKKEEALQALKNKQFSTAIKICLTELEKNPDNYELQFILARAYAFSKQWDKAGQIINEILKCHPKNIDVLLLKARIQAWRGNYSESKEGFKYILSLDPKNEEALMGLADKARWQGNLKEFKDTFEVRYHHRIQTFNDDRKDYIDNQFNFYINIPTIRSSLLLWLDQTRRFDTQDHQYKLELYPKLWQKSYGHFYFTFSPKSTHYPSSSYLAEIYQNFLASAEISLGYRKMDFKENPVSIYMGSLGYYWNQYYSWLRLYYIPEEKGNSLSWTANIRRYFSIDDYIFLGFGMGSRPFEVMTIEDLWTSQVKIFSAGFNFFVFKNLRLQFFYSHWNEKEGLKRNSFLIITGFRF